MIHYNVWFSLEDGAVEAAALAKVRRHGAMIEQVSTFIVEVFEEVAE
jgi:hypothetical protein